RGPHPPPPPSAPHPPFVRPIGFAAARPPRFHQNFVSNNPRFQPRQQHPRLHHRPPWPVGRQSDADEDAAKAIGVYQNGRTAPPPQPPFSASLTQPGVGRADGIGAFQFRMPPPPDQTPAPRQRRSSSDLADFVPPSKVARQRNDDDVEDGSTPGVSFDDLVGQDELHDKEEPGGQGEDEEPHPDAWAGQAETLLSSRYCRALQLASVEPGAARIRGAAAVTTEPDAGLLGQLAGFITQQEPPVVHFYSCDYCSFCTEYDGQAAVKLTHEHLSAAGHDSASRYGRTRTAGWRWRTPASWWRRAAAGGPPSPTAWPSSARPACCSLTASSPAACTTCCTMAASWPATLCCRCWPAGRCHSPPPTCANPAAASSVWPTSCTAIGPAAPPAAPSPAQLPISGLCWCGWPVRTAGCSLHLCCRPPSLPMSPLLGKAPCSQLASTSLLCTPSEAPAATRRCCTCGRPSSASVPVRRLELASSLCRR
ncbi:hypothetical protein BOX15_Mlig021819g1, partial [Macrostomum lignano]